MSGGSGESATLYGSTQDDPVRKPENRVRGGLLAESLASSAGVTKQASCRLLQQGFSHNSVESHAGCCYEWVVLATCYLALSVKSVSCPGCSECYILSRKKGYIRLSVKIFLACGARVGGLAAYRCARPTTVGFSLCRQVLISSFQSISPRKLFTFIGSHGLGRLLHF